MLKIKHSLLFAVGFLIHAAIFWLLVGGHLEGPMLSFLARLSKDFVVEVILISVFVWGCTFGGNLAVTMCGLNTPDTHSQKEGGA